MGPELPDGATGLLGTSTGSVPSARLTYPYKAAVAQDFATSATFSSSAERLSPPERYGPTPAVPIATERESPFDLARFPRRAPPWHSLAPR